MDSSQGSSFIPKTPMSGSLSKRRVRKIYIFTYLIYTFFIGSLLAAGGVWFYKVTVQKELAAVQVALNEERERFNQADLEKVTELDARLIEAKNVFDAQVSVLQILKAVERITLASVDMHGFTFEKDVSAKLVLELSAEAGDFNTTLFQRQVLAGDAVLGGAEVTSVTYATTPETDGSPSGSSVMFKVEKDVLPGTIKPVALSAFQTTASTPTSTTEATVVSGTTTTGVSTLTDTPQ
jgi:hypothetical protein